MKQYKIKASEYTDLAALLTRVGATEGNQAFPSDVYVNKKTMALFKSALKKLAKKKYPFLSERKLNNAVGMELLNLGPNESKDVKDGYIAVDAESIARNK